MKEDILENNKDIKVKCIVKINKVFFTKENEDGSFFSIFSAEIIDTIQGEPFTNNYNCITAKGVTPKLNYNDSYTLIAREVIDKKYGKQYNIIYINNSKPLDNKDEQKVFLRTFCSENIISKMYEMYDNPMKLLENNNIENLIKIKGIGTKMAMKLIDKYNENKDLGNLYVELDKVGLSPRSIKSLLKKFVFPEALISTIRKNPYLLMNYDGVGWKKADSIAEKEGIGRFSEFRVEAFIQYYLEQEANEGNSYIDPHQLMSAILYTIGEDIDRKIIKTVIYNMHNKNVLWWNEKHTKIGLYKYYNLEYNIAKELQRIAEGKNTFELGNWELKVTNMEEKQGWKFTEEQREAIKMALNNQIILINGGAGCVDCDTEYFDGTKWKKIANYTYGDKVLQYNKDSSSELVYPLKYHKLPCDNLWHFSTKYGVDQCLSEEHNVYYITSKNNLYHKTFAEVKKNHEENGFKGRFITTFKYCGTGIKYSDAQIRLLVAVKADGSFKDKRYPSICYVNLKKTRKKKRLIKLLQMNGIDYSFKHYTNGFTMFKFDMFDTEKNYTAKWYNCNLHQFQIIYDEIFYWDGDFEYKNRFFTTIKSDADFIQFVGSVCNKRGIILIQNRRGRVREANNKQYTTKTIDYIVYFTSRNLISLCYDKRSDHTKTPINKYKTVDGYKYCFTVPSHMLVLRRNNKIFITGNCGKSATVAGVLAVLNNKYSFAQTALSGRAASKLQEVTGQEGSTIHRLLGIDQSTGKFLHNKEYPLDSDIIILDEISLVGGSIFYSLLKAIPTGSKLIMLGDDGQLESIGSLNIAKDLINSKYISHITLTKTHRQAEKSAIITESKKVRQGQQIIDKAFNGIEVRGEKQDLELNIYDDKSLTKERVIDYFKKGLVVTNNNIKEVQIIVPMKERGDACVYNLNKLAQKIYNPSNDNKNEIVIGTKESQYILREGDKVLNTKNNYKTVNEDGYEAPIFNGQIGIITDINIADGIISVKFPYVNKRDILLPREAWSSLILGYACTCHKLQGDSSKYVIIGLDYSSYKLLSKQWVYTAITRAEQYCVLCAENNALRYAINQDKVGQKNTFLKEFLDSFKNN